MKVMQYPQVFFKDKQCLSCDLLPCQYLISSEGENWRKNLWHDHGTIMDDWSDSDCCYRACG